MRFTVAALSVVLGLSSALALPLLCPWQGQLLLTALCAGLALLPFGVLGLVWRRRHAPSVPLLPLALASALLSGLVLAPLFAMYRGQVRVLNHGEEPFALVVDGKRVARVDPSSGESALAGVEVTLPAGERELRVVAESDGRELFSGREVVEGGRSHLFAPLSAGYCFTIERRGYGDAKNEVERHELSGPDPFWVVPDGISWFAPSPEPGPFQTSGGTLSCLRQKRCRN